MQVVENFDAEVGKIWAMVIATTIKGISITRLAP